MEKQILLFENLKRIKDYWAFEATNSLNPETDMLWSDFEDDYRMLQKKLISSDEQKAFLNVQNEIIKGVIHSILVMIDGGDALADRMKIDIIDEGTKESLKENIALHEEFVGYLLDVE